MVDEFTIEMVKIMEEAVELDVKLKAEAVSYTHLDVYKRQM